MNNNLNIIYSENPAHEAGKILNEELKGDKSVLLLTSGGSSFEILDYIEKENLSSKITIGIVDERVTENPEHSNFKQLQNLAFYKSAEESGVNFLDLDLSSDDLKKSGEKFEGEIKKWEEKNPGGKIICTLGIGKDAHIAGIMPFPENKELFEELFENHQKQVVVYDAKGKNEHSLRVTVTNTFLRKVDLAVVFVKGEEKRNALKEVLEGQEKVFEKPGRIIHNMKKVFVCTDLKF